jgi:fluoride ion exporter CrcB/FEX
MQQIFWLAIAGMVGTLSRFGINGFCQRFFGEWLLWQSFVYSDME